MQALREFWQIIRDLWDTNTQIARGFLRIALVILLIWPAVAIVIATINHDAALAVIPMWGFLLVFAALIVVYYFPLITTVVAVVAPTRSILQEAILILIIEIGIGIYFTLVDVASDRKLIPLLVLVIAGIILLLLAKKGRALSFFKFIFWMIFIILTLIFVFGGREEIKEKASAAYYVPPAHPAPYPQDYNKKETRRFEYTDGDGVMVKLQTNCDKEDFIAVVPPHHQIKIHHVYFDETVKANRCSYNVYGESFPVAGPPEDLYKNNEFAHDLVAPQFIALKSLIKFVGEKTEFHDFKRNGDEIVFENCSEGDARVYHMYNISKGVLFSGSAQQIGHDGSTVTFEGVITPIKCSN